MADANIIAFKKIKAAASATSKRAKSTDTNKAEKDAIDEYLDVAAQLFRAEIALVHPDDISLVMAELSASIARAKRATQLAG